MTERKRGTQWRDGWMKDDTWTWLEGRRGSVWMALYCFREEEALRARAALSNIMRKQRAGEKLGEGLDEFKEFRVHPINTWMESEATLEEVRNLHGGYALSRIMRAFNRCGKVKKSTGDVCLLPPGHLGHHSPHLPRE